MESRINPDNILVKANEAKDRLYEIAQELEAAGYHRKAESCMNLIYRIEEWQNGERWF